MNKQLMNRVLEQIREDVEKYNDFTAIEELLQHCPEDKLVGYLCDVMEDDWKYSDYSSQMSLETYIQKS